MVNQFSHSRLLSVKAKFSSVCPTVNCIANKVAQHIPSGLNKVWSNGGPVFLFCVDPFPLTHLVNDCGS